MPPDLALLVRHLGASLAPDAIIVIPSAGAFLRALSQPATPASPEQPQATEVHPVDHGSHASPTSTASAGQPHTAQSHGTKARRSLAERVMEICSREGDVARSRDEWTTLLGHGTGRLLGRILQHAPVQTSAKGTGKDHRTQLIAASKLASVFSTIEAVKAGRLSPAPAWYEQVCSA